MSAEARSILILYGSETGNAKDVAERIGREARRRHFSARVIAMDIFPMPTLIDEQLVVFVCSTTGNGIEPANMTPLWRALLRAELPPDLFEDMDFAVLGLGDSSYQRFNWAAKRLQRRLLSLGGHEICERGEADDQHPRGLDGTMEPWTASLFGRVMEMYPLPPGVEVLSNRGLYPPTLHITPCSTEPLSSPAPDRTRSLFAPTHDVTLTQNIRITKDDWYQDVRHVILKADGAIKYEPGDVAILYPENSPPDVDALLRRLRWEQDADLPIYVTPGSSDLTLPLGYPSSTTPTTLRSLIAKHAEITAVPRKSFMELLSHFTTDQLETEKLREFCTPEGQDDLFDYTTRVRRTILEVLLEFRSAVIPKEYIADLFPELRPRQFSIASSLSVHPSEIHLCIAIVSYKTKLRIPRKGVCTTWLAALQPGTKLCIGLKQGTMHLPEETGKPVVFVGPGTGVAPMRAMVEERIARGALENVLYFGCRSSNSDYHFRSEWEAYQSRGELTHRLAASRDQDTKVYVQDLISLDSRKIKEWLVDCKGYVYISGSSNQMPTAVRKAVIAGLRNECQWSEEKSTDYVNAMELQGRWCEECW
ncbi:riboflavin synthase domain-like protein [Ceratobasidium sp. AG-I]|nr:riboflavin synthase domain-like protein [Ceratobasidium sp. AG-I]